MFARSEPPTSNPRSPPMLKATIRHQAIGMRCAGEKAIDDTAQYRISANSRTSSLKQATCGAPQRGVSAFFVPRPTGKAAPVIWRARMASLARRI
jgi:hypothetical protein